MGRELSHFYLRPVVLGRMKRPMYATTRVAVATLAAGNGHTCGFKPVL
jgi:hypothetical protein